MKAKANHIQLNVHDVQFYKNLFTYFEFPVYYETDDAIGVGAGEVALWVFKVKDEHKGQAYSRHARGIHHLGFQVDHKEDVDTFFVEFVKKNNLKYLNDGPKDRPDYGDSYYEAVFEDPEGMVIEVVYKKS